MTTLTWQPTATLQTLHARAIILAQLRQFFLERQVLEVETPLLSHATVTDPYVVGIPAYFRSHAGKGKTVYLQTSPEYAMKRLLAAGSGAIYQISKAFRQGDLGTIHNPEFTMLEWYRPGFDHHALMDEMDALLQLVLESGPAERVSYADAFEKILRINPHYATDEELAACVQTNTSFKNIPSDRNAALDLLMTHCVEPAMHAHVPTFIYDFPISHAALAKIRREEPPVASRFEVYFKGVELANGFHELQDVEEQRKRFAGDLVYRERNSLPSVVVDENFLAALQVGIPDCAGVALGVDRLVMLALGQKKLGDVLSFDFNRA